MVVFKKKLAHILILWKFVSSFLFFILWMFTVKSKTQCFLSLSRFHSRSIVDTGQMTSQCSKSSLMKMFHEWFSAAAWSRRVWSDAVLFKLLSGPYGSLESLSTAPYWTSLEDASGVLELGGDGHSPSLFQHTHTYTLTLWSSGPRAPPPTPSVEHGLLSRTYTVKPFPSVCSVAFTVVWLRSPLKRLSGIGILVSHECIPPLSFSLSFFSFLPLALLKKTFFCPTIFLSDSFPIWRSKTGKNTAFEMHAQISATLPFCFLSFVSECK